MMKRFIQVSIERFRPMLERGGRSGAAIDDEAATDRAGGRVENADECPAKKAC